MCSVDAKKAVKERWMSITEGMSADVVEKWWTLIESNYSQDVRKYLTLQHLSNMFEHFDSCCDKLSSPKAVLYAIVFHDLVHDPKSQDNEEKSAEKFKEFCSDVDNDQMDDLKDKVVELIMETKTHSTDEHKAADTFGSEDVHYFLDFDMAILGYDAEVYKEYSEQIRSEYSFLSSNMYNMLRLKVLTSFLQIPNIFATEMFRSMYETKARENIQREIDGLEETQS